MRGEKTVLRQLSPSSTPSRSLIPSSRTREGSRVPLVLSARHSAPPSSPRPPGHPQRCLGPAPQSLSSLAWTRSCSCFLFSVPAARHHLHASIYSFWSRPSLWRLRPRPLSPPFPPPSSPPSIPRPRGWFDLGRLISSHYGPKPSFHAKRIPVAWGFTSYLTPPFFCLSFIGVS